MTGQEGWQISERNSFVPSGQSAASLSQSVQSFFEPMAKSRENLPLGLDMGSLVDLYKLAAYTGDRLPGRVLMTDDAEQKLDAPKIQPPSDAISRPSVIRTKEDEAIWDAMQQPHKLGKDESATHIGLTQQVIDDMKKKGQASKLGFFDSAAEGALAALQEPPKEKPNLIASAPESKDVVSDMTRGGMPMSGTLLPEPWMVKLSSDFIGALTSIAWNVTASKFQEIVDAVKKAVVNPIEHPFRGHEEETLSLIPAQGWSDAYKAYPDLKEIGGLSEAESTKLMKAIIGNELTFYGPEDKAEDAICDAGQGSTMFKQTIGFAQIAPKGVRDLSAEFDREVKAGARKRNPLHELAALADNDLAKAMLKPESIPLLVGAVTSHNVQMFNRHKSEVEMKPLTLGYMFNPDYVYAKTDRAHEHLMTKKEAEKKGIDYFPAFPNKKVLALSEHAHNIEKWLKKLGG